MKTQFIVDNKSKRKVIKIPYSIMESHSIKSGDFVFVKKGKKRTVAMAFSHDDTIKKVVIDPLISFSLDLSSGDYIEIEKCDIETKREGNIILSIDMYIDKRIANEIVNSIKSYYMNVPFIENDIIPVSVDMENHSVVIKGIKNKVVILSPSVSMKVVSRIFHPSPLNFDEIGGLKKVKEIIKNRILLPLEHPEIFEIHNIKTPKGVLLYGPPGTGKTMMMRALANQLDNCQFIEISASDIFTKYYGEGENRIAKIFKSARENPPSIIFIDEFDSIASKRKEFTGNMEHRIIGKFLSEMDGLKSTDNVIVIASTNRPNDIDDAFRRTGRFDYEIEFHPPDPEERLEILKIHTSNLKLAKDVNLKEIAEKCHGYVGADLYGVVTEGFIQCVMRALSHQKRKNKKLSPKSKLLRVTRSDFENAMKIVRPSLMRDVYIDRVSIDWDDIVGLEKEKDILENFVSFKLLPPKKIKNLNVELPCNVFLYGPPGCGKTMLIKALAKKLGVNFFYIKSPEIMTKWVGESAQNIKRVFKKATQSQPSIVFIDEIDAISVHRNLSSHPSDIQVLTQLLLEIDAARYENVFVIAATNQPYLVDPALIRTGRFDIQLYVSPPSDDDRIIMLKHFLSSIPYQNIKWEEIKKNTMGFTPSDLKSVVKFLMIEFVKSEKNYIDHEDLINAIKKVAPSLSKEIIRNYESFQKKSIIIKRIDNFYS